MCSKMQSSSRQAPVEGGARDGREGAPLLTGRLGRRGRLLPEGLSGLVTDLDSDVEVATV